MHEIQIILEDFCNVIEINVGVLGILVFILWLTTLLKFILNVSADFPRIVPCHYLFGTPLE